MTECGIHLRVTGHSANPRGPLLLFEIELIQSGLFSVPKEMEFGELVKHHAPSMLFPFARKAVADYIVQAGFQPIALTHLDFQQSTEAATWQRAIQPAIADQRRPPIAIGTTSPLTDPVLLEVQALERDLAALRLQPRKTESVTPPRGQGTNFAPFPGSAASPGAVTIDSAEQSTETLVQRAAGRPGRARRIWISAAAATIVFAGFVAWTSRAPAPPPVAVVAVDVQPAPPAAAEPKPAPQPAPAAMATTAFTLGAQWDALGVEGREWLLAQDKSGYSILVASVSGPKALDDLSSLRLDQPLHLVGRERDAIVLYGVYDSLSETMTAIGTLPDALRAAAKPAALAGL
jgi:septal ring-binding cell division protein DamX